MNGARLSDPIDERVEDEWVEDDERAEEGGSGREIAVIGMTGQFPGAENLDVFWDNLATGVESVTFFSDEELAAAGVDHAVLENPSYVKAASLLDNVDRFEDGFFGYTPREAEIMDPQQRLFLEHCWAALEDAGYTPGSYEGLIGVYAGVAWNTYLLSNLTTRPELFDGAGGFQVFITNDKDFMSTRASYKLNLKGPSVILQTSCSTSLVAVHLACLSLLSFECDTALVGGVTVKVPQREGYFYQPEGLASPDGHCRAFDASAQGTIFGSGVGAVVLKRLAEALEDGDTIRAVIKGSAINNDGAVKVSYTAPSVAGQSEVVAAALEMAGVGAETIRYIETHGTGTSLGDPIEVAALTRVFRAETEARQICALGSVKTNIGHLDAAAGIAGLIKSVLALEHRQLPPSLNFERPNPAIDFSTSPFYVNTELSEMAATDAPRRVGVSSFGVGGTNAHVILEEAPPQPPQQPSRPWQLLVLSARSEPALDAVAARLGERLREEDLHFPDVAYTLKVGRAVFRHRRMLVCQDRDQALAALADPAGGWLAAVDDEEPRSRPVVFLFSGQGTQYPQMAGELYRLESVFRQQVDRASDLLLAELGLDLRRVLFPEPGNKEDCARRLAQTRFAQPALFVTELALARLWMSWGVQPQAMLGHSIGEYVAACLSGVLSLEDALRLVAERGRLMQELPPGAMLAVPLSAAELQAWLGEELSLASVNEPERCVASGPEPAIEALASALAEQGVKSRRLHTSHAFHSRMMEPIEEPFRAALRGVELRPPTLPYISNVSGTWITSQQATDPDYWVQHLRRPVLFADGIAELLEDPQRVLLEVGPGRTLTTLAGRHPRRAGHPVVPSLPAPGSEHSDLAVLLTALGRLWLAGVELDWVAFYDDERRRRVRLPTYPFERRRYWIEPGERGVQRSPAGSEKRPDLGDWFYLPSWKPSLVSAIESSSAGDDPPGRWLLFADRQSPWVDGLKETRRVTLVVAGDSFERLEEDLFQIRPDRSEDYLSLLATLAEEGDEPRAAIHAWGVRPGEAGICDIDGFEASQRLGFYSLQALARALAQSGTTEPLNLLVVADRWLRVTAVEEQLPEKATMSGLLKVLPQELPNVRCRALDVERLDATLVPRLLAELATPDGDEEVAYRGRQRWVRAYEPVRLAAPGDGHDPLRPGGVYLVTGGLTGNGWALASYFAREFQARLVLLVDAEAGGVEPVSESRRVQSLEAWGAEVLVIHADLTGAAEMSAAVASAEERFGRLHGVIHAAGTAGPGTFRTLSELDRETCGWHFRPKVHALFALDQALAGRQLDFRVLMSSLATAVGGLAYGAYTAANHFMDAFAGASGGAWRSVGWDVWRFEDEAEQITEVREDLAALAMTPREGEEAIKRFLAAPASDLILVSTCDLEARLDERRQRIIGRRGALPDGAATTAERHPRPELETAFTAPGTDVERAVAEIWQAILGFESIGLDDNFFDLGGDSFLAVQVAARLQETLGVELPAARLYQGLTVRSLARHLAQDDNKADAERADLLAERRASMGRRKQLQQQRRASRQERQETHHG